MANINKGIAKAQTQVAKQQAGLKGLLLSMQDKISKALPSVLTPERYTRMVMTALSTNPDLQKCTPESFLGAVMQAAQLGLEPNTPLGQAWLIPYKNKGRLECQFQIGYQGLIDLAYRSGEISIIDAQTVCENDFFEYEYGLTPKLKFKPAMKDRGEVIAYYAMFKTKSEGYNFLVTSKEDIEKFAARYSQSYNSSYSPWKRDFDEMAKKTALKKALKYAPKKSEFARALSVDETIKTDIVENMADLPDETEPIDITPIVTDVQDVTTTETENELPFGDDEE